MLKVLLVWFTVGSRLVASGAGPVDSRLPENVDTRQEQRERKLKKKRERIAKHGRNLAIIYKEAIIKRIAKAKNKAKGGSPRG